MNQDFFNPANNWTESLQNMNKFFNNNAMQDAAQHFTQAVQSFGQGIQEIVRRNTAAIQENTNNAFNNTKNATQFSNTEEFMQNYHNNLHEQLHHSSNHVRENTHVLFQSYLEAFDHMVQAMGCCKQACKKSKAAA